MTKCIGVLGRLFGHKFRARYDEEETPPPVGKKFKAYGAESVAMLKQLRGYTRTYKHDVCVRCGEKVLRD